MPSLEWLKNPNDFVTLDNMIDSNFIDDISGLRELLLLVPEEYSFHDAELESAEWSHQDCELVVRYFCFFGLKRQIRVTFYLKPEMNDFTIELSPHNPYTYELEISRSESQLSKYHFRADGSGPEVDCTDIRIETEFA